MSVTVDSAVIARMLQSDLAKQIPCLQKPPREYGKLCGGCNSDAALDYNKIKECLASSSAADLERMKAFLGTTTLRFKIPIGGPRPQVQTWTR